MWNKTLQAIENVIDRRSARGASDKSIISWLNHLKTIYKDTGSHKDIDGFIDAIQQTPLITERRWK